LAGILNELNPGSIQFSSISDEMKGRDIDYVGNEVCTAVPLSLRQVVPGLPPRGFAGRINLLDVVEDATRQWLAHPNAAQLADACIDFGWPPARIHFVFAAETRAILLILLQHGILTRFDQSTLMKAGGRSITNGMFGVIKKGSSISTSSGPLPPLRLIMNLVPSSSCLQQYPASIGKLAVEQAWNKLPLMHWEMMLFSSRDRRAYFYTLRLPPGWASRMALCEPVSTADADAVLAGTSIEDICAQDPCWEGGFELLGSAVFAMGWASAVGISQKANRIMLRRAGGIPPSPTTSLRWDCELRADCPQPLNGNPSRDRIFQLYVDNADEGRIVHRGDEFIRGKSEFGDTLDAYYASWDSPDCEADRRDSEPCLESLGVRTCGVRGHRDLPKDYISRLCQFTYLLLVAKVSPIRVFRVCLARWVRVMLRNRSCFMVFQHCWQHAQHRGWGGPLPTAVVHELVAALCLCPLMHTDPRKGLSSLAAATDASNFGGGVCLSDSLTASGVRYLNSALSSHPHPAQEDMLLFSCFDGISGARVAPDVLGVLPAVFVSCEIDPSALRVSSIAFPAVIQLGDITKIIDDMLHRLKREHNCIKRTMFAAGYPCKNMSGVNRNRQGLHGKHTNLEYAELKSRVAAIWPEAEIGSVQENVASAAADDVAEANSVLGSCPWQLNASMIFWAERKRLY